MGVVTSNLVVTTQEGVVTTPNTPLFNVFWGYDLTTPLLRPFGPPDPIQMPTPHRPLPRHLAIFEVCLSLPWHAARFRITARCVRRHRAASPAISDPCHRRCNRPQAWHHRHCLQAERAPRQPGPRATNTTKANDRRHGAGETAVAPCSPDRCVPREPATPLSLAR
jgi:hypothetical protein